MSDDKTRRVVCAAIRSINGELLLGIRHYSEDMQKQIDMRIDSSDFWGRQDADQGFVDQHGTFMSRADCTYFVHRYQIGWKRR